MDGDLDMPHPRAVETHEGEISAGDLSSRPQKEGSVGQLVGISLLRDYMYAYRHANSGNKAQYSAIKDPLLEGWLYKAQNVTLKQSCYRCLT